MIKDYRTSKHAEHDQLWLRIVATITLAISIKIGENNLQTSWKVLKWGWNTNCWEPPRSRICRTDDKGSTGEK